MSHLLLQTLLFAVSQDLTTYDYIVQEQRKERERKERRRKLKVRILRCFLARWGNEASTFVTETISTWTPEKRRLKLVVLTASDG